MNRGKLYFFIFISVILGMVTLQLQLHQRLDRRGLKDLSLPTSVESLIKSDSPRQNVAPLSIEQQSRDEKVSAEFLNQFIQESIQVELSYKDAEELDKHRQSWARHLDENEIDFLATVVQDRSRRSDERKLALDLLGRNQSSKSLVHLKDFVLSSDSVSGDARARLDEEMIFKVQAVEEIAASTSLVEAIGYLTEIQKKTVQSFVKDRAQRSLSSLKDFNLSSDSPAAEVPQKLTE